MLISLHSEDILKIPEKLKGKSVHQLLITPDFLYF